MKLIIIITLLVIVAMLSIELNNKTKEAEIATYSANHSWNLFQECLNK
jgi:hypothetical protein